MKSLKTDLIEVGVKQFYNRDALGNYYYWRFNGEPFGISCVFTQISECKTKSGAKRNWMRFAKRNGFKNWKFVK